MSFQIARSNRTAQLSTQTAIPKKIYHQYSAWVFKKNNKNCYSKCVRPDRVRRPSTLNFERFQNISRSTTSSPTLTSPNVTHIFHNWLNDSTALIGWYLEPFIYYLSRWTRVYIYVYADRHRRMNKTKCLFYSGINLNKKLFMVYKV